MKTFIYLSFLICMISISFSQDPVPYCDPGCESSPWFSSDPGGTVIQNLPNCPMCEIRIWYKYRYNACQQKYEVLLVDWAWWSRTCPTCNDCQTCINSQYSLSFMSSWVFNQMVAHNVFTNNPSILPNGECRDYFSAGYFSCFRQEWVNNSPIHTGGYWHVVKCGTSSCCLFTYRVCKDINGNIVPFPCDIIGYQIPPNPECEEGCEPFCKDIVPRIGIQDEQKTITQGEIKLLSNMENETINIKFSNVLTGLYTFSIFDLKGNIVYQDNLIISSQNIEKLILLRNYVSGAYIYQINYGDQLIQGGKIIIEK